MALAEQLAWLARQGQGFAAVHVNASAANLGLWANKKRAVAAAFELSDFVVVLEDDVTLERDGLRWFEWHVTSGLIFSQPNLALATCWSASFPYWPAAVEGRDALAVRELGLLDKYWVRKGWGGGRLGLLGAAGTAGNRRGWVVLPCRWAPARPTRTPPEAGCTKGPSCAQAHRPLPPTLPPCTPAAVRPLGGAVGLGHLAAHMGRGGRQLDGAGCRPWAGGGVAGLGGEHPPGGALQQHWQRGHSPGGQSGPAHPPARAYQRIIQGPGGLPVPRPAPCQHQPAHHL